LGLFEFRSGSGAGQIDGRAKANFTSRGAGHAALDLNHGLGTAARGAVRDDAPTATGPDREFERQMVLARFRWNLLQAAHECAEQLRRDGLGITTENLQGKLTLAVANVRPRSALIPWFVENAAAVRMIDVVVSDFLAEFSEAKRVGL
jgi:hypothetical protein